MNYEERDTFGMYRTTAAEATAPDDMKHGPGPHLMGADTLIGNDVYNSNGDDLGDIKEIMLDMRSGRVSYAVLSFGGFLGMGDKLFAVPWDALTLDTMNKRFVLDISPERLEGAPGFDKDQWPNMANQAWSDEIHTYYQTKPYSDELRP
ncbi:MAG: photosystem reaction center subunit H [Betaproteobacteria bacterium HGW-Betaproteobacteria-21]|nr:MAG: photosystem reaction center subunit H [Betaproteobacteria bacterium HGW-Betaproteobacteria-21]